MCSLLLTLFHFSMSSPSWTSFSSKVFREQDTCEASVKVDISKSCSLDDQVTLLLLCQEILALKKSMENRPRIILIALKIQRGFTAAKVAIVVIPSTQQFKQKYKI